MMQIAIKMWSTLTIIGGHVFIINEYVDHKARFKHIRYFFTTHVHTNGTVRIQHGYITQDINIMPYFEKKSSIHSYRPHAHIWMGVIN